MSRDVSPQALAAMLILGDLKSAQLSAHAVVIDGGSTYQLTHFGQGAAGCRCCGGTAGSVNVNGCTVEVNSRAHHRRRMMVFVLEPADVESDEMRPSERELIGDALVVLTQHLTEKP